MIMFLVEFDNGMDWDDHRRDVIGVYSTEEKAREIADELDKEEAEGGFPGRAVITVVTVDERIY